MKRLKQFVIMSFAAVILAVVPVSVSVPHLAIGPSVALADDCIALSVPIDAKAQQGSCPPGQIDNSVNGGAIVAYITLLLKFLASLIGGIIVLMLMIGGIQYVTSAGDPGQVKAAKDRIVNAITALVLFALMFAFLNFIIPGGILV